MANLTNYRSVIDSCKNFGKVEIKGTADWGLGELVGQVGDGFLSIQNCEIYTQSFKPVIGATFSSTNTKEEKTKGVSIYKLKYNSGRTYDYLQDGAISVIMLTNSKVVEIKAKEIEINIKGETAYIALVGRLVVEATAEFANIKINIDCKKDKGATNSRLFLNTPKGVVLANGVVIELREEGKKSNEYYGTDFSSFYCDWKTGKIGLKAMSGKGFYQGEMNEEMLIAKGFLKKSL